MTDALVVYLTAPSKDEATFLARTLVEERLAACVNVFPSVLSFYSWNGVSEENHELVLIAKTRASLWDKLARRVKEVHPDACPCLISMPVEAASDEFLSWIFTATQDPDAPPPEESGEAART